MKGGARAHAGLICLWLWWSGCASGPAGVADALRHGRLRDALAAYDRGQPDLGALQRIAAVVLEQEAQGKDARQRAQALAALEVARPLSRAALDRLATHATDPRTRATALATLARFGDAAARAALLRRLDDPDADLRAIAIGALDPEADAVLLRGLCEVPALALRQVAVHVLARAHANGENGQLLARIARFDPALSVRVVAIDALGAQGPSAADAIEDALDAEDLALRLAAVNALVRSDYARAAQRLARYLADTPALVGIEAARVLLATDAAHAPAAARSQLERALAEHDNALRAASAVALMSLRDTHLAGVIRERAGHEAVRSVRLNLTLALGAEDAGARLLLSKLMTSQKDIVGAEAAAALARRGDPQALETLLDQSKRGEPLVRRAAVRALALELGRAHDVRSAMFDRDSSIRIAAAGAILAAPAI